MKSLTTLLKKKTTLVTIIAAILVITGYTAYYESSLLTAIVTFAMISLVMAFGFQIFYGNSGILAWSFVGFVGIGAFTSAIFSVPPEAKAVNVKNMYPFLVAIDSNIFVGILVAVTVAAIVAAIIAWPVMRLSDSVAVITQFAVLNVMYVIFNQWDNFTNGQRAYSGLPHLTTLWVAAGGAIIALFIAYFFKESAMGIRLRASRDDRFAATSCGVNVISQRYFAFILSAAVAAFAGVLWGHYTTSFAPNQFYIAEMFVLISMVVVGGSKSITGVFLGVAIVTVLRKGIEQFENSLGFAGYNVSGLAVTILAVALIAILIMRPEGLTKGREFTWANVLKIKAWFSKKFGTKKPALEGATSDAEI